jgi:hypothetical protein
VDTFLRLKATAKEAMIPWRPLRIADRCGKQRSYVGALQLSSSLALKQLYSCQLSLIQVAGKASCTLWWSHTLSSTWNSFFFQKLKGFT